MFCIVLADRPHGSWKLFLKPGLRVKKLNSRSRVDRESAIAPRLDLLTPPRLITTTTMADDMLVFVLQKILSLSGLLGQNILLLCHQAEQKKKDYGQPHTPHRFRSTSKGFLLLLSFFYTARKLFVHAPSLLLHFWWISPVGLEYEPQRVETFTMDPFGRRYSWNDAEEDGVKKIVLARVDMD